MQWHQERGVVAGYSGPREQVHRQINQKIQCGFRPRVGLASTRHVRHLWLLLPCPQSSAAAAPTAVPGASVATRVSQGEGPSIHWEEAPWREHCRPECPRGGPCVPLPTTRQRSYPHAARKWYRQRDGFLSIPSGPSKDGFREP